MTTAASTHHAPRFDGRWLLEVLTLAALYFLTARLGLLMAIPGGHVTPVWPPSGIALAALLLRGRRVWPGIWIGSFAANLWDFYGSPVSLTTEVAVSATFGMGASLAALLGSQLLRRFVGERNPLERVRDVCAFMALGGAVSCLVSATIGVTTLCLAGFAPWPGYGPVWLTWWLGDTAGVLIAAPLLLVWGGTLWRTSMARWVELFCGFGLLIAVTYYVFIENTIFPFAGEPLPFALVPFLIWSAVRFGRRGAAVAVGLIALLAVWGTIHGSGPFNLGSRHESLLALELFLSVVSLTALCLAAAVTAQRHAEDNRRRVLDELESRVMERTAALNQANAALAEQAVRYKTLTEMSADSIYVLDTDGDLQEANAEFLRRRGFDAAEMKGLNVADWDARWTREELKERMRQLVGGNAVFETRHRCKDGSIFDAEVGATSVRIAGQELFFCVTRDITERKQAERARHESEERFRQLAENISEIFWVWTAVLGNAQCLYVSPAYATIWGRSCESLYSSPQSWKEALHPSDKERVLAEIANLDMEKMNDLTYRIVRPDQSIRWIRDRIFPVRNVSGAVVRFAGIAEDITERKQAEAALAARARQQAVIAELGKLALAGGALHGLFSQTVARVAETLGVEYCEVLKLLPDGSAVRLVAGVGWKEGLVGRATVALGPDSQAGYTLQTKNLIIVEDLRRETRFRGQPLLREHGVVSGLSVIIGEVEKPFGILGAHTARQQKFTADDTHFFQSVANMLAEAIQNKQAEDRLRRSEEKFKTLFGIAPIGISVLDRQHNVIDANPALAQITRLRREELLNGPHPHRTILNADGTPKLPHEFSSERAMAENRPIYGEEAGIVLDNGEIVWVLVSVAPVALPEPSAVVITQDITARKQAEQALRESEERFRELAENINEVFWVWTATPGNARCLYVSPAYATIWRRSCESLYSSPQSWMEALHPQDRERVQEEGARMDFEKITDWTYRIVHPDQSTRWIRDRIFPVRDARGSVVRFAGIAQDITESKEAEQTVRKTNRQLRNLSRRRIQEQEDERRRLSRELHDQIGQSLTAAKINVEALRSTKNPALFGRLDETAAILDQLLGQVRQISLDLRPPMLDDLGLVPALRSFIDEQGRRASVAVRFSAEHIPEKLDPEIQITCFRIVQEAITNALRHAKATQLDIALRCMHGKTLRILARDDGIGFDAHPTQGQAVDLGLIGIRERAALVGGRTRIISSPHKGTTIDVSLPLAFRPEH